MTSLHDVDELLPQLRLLGTTELQVRDRVVRNLGGRGGALLLARLALAPRQAHPRETLIDQIWPDAELEVGRNRLRNALSVLRAALADAGCDDIVQADRESVRLAPGALVCDVHRFEEAVTRQQWLDARHAYAGELMPGHFQDWIEDERHRLAALAERIPPHLPALSAQEEAAMELIDRARRLARRGSPRFEDRAVALLQQAADLAPGFALPHIHLAMTMHSQALRMVGRDRREGFLRANEHIARAASLDPRDPRTQALALGARYRHDLDFFQTRERLLALVEQFPNAITPMTCLVIIHNDVGRSVEAEAWQRRAQHIEPLSVIALYNIAVSRMNGYRFAGALAAFDELLELEPDHGNSLIGRFFALAGLNRLDEARAQARLASQAGVVGADELNFYDACCAHWAGDAARASQLHHCEDTLALCAREPAYAVLRLVHLGRHDEAWAQVRRMHEDADPSLVVVFGSRNGLDTRRDPRIDAIALSLGWRPLDQMLADAARAA